MKCYFCDKPAMGIYRVCVDAEPDHDDEGGMTMMGIYANVGLCEQHKREWIEQEGIFERQY